jgi:hypothetical protein
MGREGFEPSALGLRGVCWDLGRSRPSWKTSDFERISAIRSRRISVELVAPVLPPALGAIREVLGQAAQSPDSNQPRQIVPIRLVPLNPLENRHPARRLDRREADGSLTQGYVCFPSTLKRPADHLAIPAPWARDPRDHSEHVRSPGARRADRGRPED